MVHGAKRYAKIYTISISVLMDRKNRVSVMHRFQYIPTYVQIRSLPRKLHHVSKTKFPPLNSL